MLVKGVPGDTKFTDGSWSPVGRISPLVVPKGPCQPWVATPWVSPWEMWFAAVVVAVVLVCPECDRTYPAAAPSGRYGNSAAPQCQ